jgi:ribonuclease BN (tRNA processing enzyme)
MPDIGILLKIILSGILFVYIAPASAEYQPSPITRVVMLGTGTPNPDPERSGPGVAIVVNDTPYIVDFGPGIVRRAASLSPAYGGSIKGLDVKRIKRAFLSHMHSDHTSGFADLIFTPWIKGRDEPLDVYGPPGIIDMASHLLKAYQQDIRYRVYGRESANDKGWRVNAHEVKEGTIYKDENVTVDAFKVRHGTWPNAFGYRFTTPDRIIVLSGDAALDTNLEKYSQGADILIHEAYSVAGASASAPAWQKYMSDNHTSTHELGELAARLRPDLLLLYHVVFLGSSEEEIVAEVKHTYSGQTILANDLDVF